MTGPATELEHWSHEPGQLPPHEGGVVLVLLPAAAAQVDAPT
ncbi:hypothetical protein O2W15_16465 [Modestobacter sp. VKM Ac-2979]|nr:MULTISPECIES: hypothetical protein [unclassified Modestobacter]MCZ2813030.1 hypothetical protein [Modestobacter sp. VKM Ac-2979]MCZ2842941.1 hypothetical protein [Modestobacter sp. VKM Ac-2980]